MSDLDELEQGERVRNWLRENGSTLVTGVMLGLAVIFGWQWWQNAQAQSRMTAATQFEAFTDTLDQGDTASAQAFAEALREKHGKTAFATLASLRMAESLAGDGETAAAHAMLEAAPRGSDPGLNSLLELRLARLEIALGQAEVALARVASPVKGFESLSSELRGDALASLGRADEARDAFDEALAHIDEASPARDIVKMKRDDLARTGPEA